MSSPSVGLILDQAKPGQPIRVISVAPGGLAAASDKKILPGDELVSVDDEMVSDRVSRQSTPECTRV